MIAHATPLEEDLAREEWFTERDARQKKRREELEAVEKRRTEVIQMQRSYEEREREKERLKKEGAKAKEFRVDRDGHWVEGFGEGQTQERGRTWR